jgi:hypothetical protein
VIGQKRRKGDAVRALHAVTVSSERLTTDPGWAEVPAGQIIVLRRDRAPQFVDARTGVAKAMATVTASSGLSVA